MTITETMEREDRRSRLDEFAQATEPAPGDGNLPVPTGMYQAPPPAVFGAQQVAVYRSASRVLQTIKELAAAAGQDWYYRYPVKNRKTGRTDWIEGPSIKMANDLSRIYGNCEVDCRAEDMGNAIMFHARFLDLETGYALTRPFQQRKGVAKIGGDDDGRRDDMTFQIGASKAIRNVVVNALQTYADFALEEARNALVDKIGRDVQGWRDRVATRLGARIDIKRAEAVVGRPVQDWLAPDIARLVAMGKAVEEGMATWDETFPHIKRGQTAPSGEEKLNTFADEGITNPGDDATADSSDDAGQTTEAQGPPPESASVVDPPDQTMVAKLLQKGAIDICLRLAGNTQLTDHEKLEQLDNIGPSLDGCTPAFVKTLIKTAAEVVSGKLKPQDARRYLEGLVK